METNKYYVRFKDTPLIGRTCTKLLISKVYDAYEITTTFVEACEEAIGLFEHSFPIANEHLSYVMREVRENVEQAMNYVSELENNYPTVIKAVHTSKASTVLLKHKKHKLEQMYS
jgi:hypothetical protein